MVKFMLFARIRLNKYILVQRHNHYLGDFLDIKLCIVPVRKLLEEFPCANKMQLNRREGELIRTMDCVNKRIEGRTLAEYYVDNKQEILEQKKQYYVDNKQGKLEKAKKYREDNKEQINKPNTCDCGGKYHGKYTNIHKSEHFKTPKHKEFIRQLSA